jgi:hypothetical protein
VRVLIEGMNRSANQPGNVITWSLAIEPATAILCALSGCGHVATRRRSRSGSEPLPPASPAARS